MDDRRELCKENSNEDIYILLYSFFIIYIFFKFFSFPHNFLSLKKNIVKATSIPRLKIIIFFTLFLKIIFRKQQPIL